MVVEAAKFIQDFDRLRKLTINSDGLLELYDGKYTLTNDKLSELPCPFGYVYDMCLCMQNLNSTKNFPTSIKNFYLENSKFLKDFEGWNLKSEMGYFNIYSCKNLSSLKGIENAKINRLIINQCPNLKTLDNMPYVENDFFYSSAERCYLQNVDAAKGRVKGKFIVKTGYLQVGKHTSKEFSNFEQFKNYIEQLPIPF